MNFCLNMCSLMGKSLAVFTEKLSFNPQCFWLKIQKHAFLKQMVSNEVLYLIKVQFVINWSS